MNEGLVVRPIAKADHEGWRLLWDGYNAFYGRSGSTSLPESITRATWSRFFSKEEPVFELVAILDSQVVGMAHYIFHRSTTRLTDVCYLQDLYTSEGQRGKGVGRQLIASVVTVAEARGCTRIYWQTQESNAAGRALYDKVASHNGFIVYSIELRVGRADA